MQNISDWEEVKQELPRHTWSTKRIWDDKDKQFHVARFMRVERSYISRDQIKQYTEELELNYGRPEYLGSWWINANNDIWMRDSVATFWMLKYGGRRPS